MDSVNYFWQKTRSAARQALRRVRPTRRLGDIEGYMTEFPETEIAFRKFLQKCVIPKPAADGKPVGIVITPWMATATPWYMLTLAIGMAQRGRRVILIWEDEPFPNPAQYLDLQTQLIRGMLDTLAPSFEIIKLSNLAEQPARADDGDRLRRIVENTLMWLVRGLIPTDFNWGYADILQTHLAHKLARVRSLFGQFEFEYVLATGGIFGSSGLYILAGREAHTRVATQDAAFGCAYVCSDGIAAHQGDLQRAFELMSATDEAARQYAIQTASQEIAHRITAQGSDSFQVTAAAELDPALLGGVVIPLNQEWDSSALGRHHIFKDSIDWLETTIDHILTNSERTVILRQHPVERLALARTHRSVVSIMHAQFGSHPRFKLIRAEDPINTYKLVEVSLLTIPFISTIGIETAVLGKHVLVAGDAPYSKSGFAWSPRTRPDYLDVLSRGLQDALPEIPKQKENAALFYYLSQSCNRVFTSFTAHPPDYWRWIKRSPQQLFTDPAVADILTALDDNIPVSFVRHQRRMRELASRPV
jgi:hypothetical protein